MMADPGDSRPGDGAGARGIERAGAIVAELADALGSALMALAEEQGVRSADRAAAIAEAARCAARSLDQSASPEIARGIDRAADGIDDIARLVRDRNWREIATETADFARRRPWLFGLGAVAIGFLAGRLLTPRVDRDGAPPAAEPAPAVADGDSDAADGAVGGRQYRELR
jgi:ElaB/YqjD/DUF883 family membrane-anchored ribosome-binding protein